MMGQCFLWYTATAVTTTTTTATTVVIIVVSLTVHVCTTSAADSECMGVCC